MAKESSHRFRASRQGNFTLDDAGLAQDIEDSASLAPRTASPVVPLDDDRRRYNYDDMMDE